MFKYGDLFICRHSGFSLYFYYVVHFNPTVTIYIFILLIFTLFVYIFYFKKKFSELGEKKDILMKKKCIDF